MGNLSSQSNAYNHIGIIGAGAWGTALAMVAAQAGRKVTLWAREAEVVASVTSHHENALFLSGVALPATIRATGEIAEAAAAEALLLAVPAQHLRAALGAFAPLLKGGTPVALCAKGIERGSGLLLNEVLAEAAPAAVPAMLSGPSFAADVARNLPTAVTIAAPGGVAARLQASLSHANFRPYASDDVLGVALGGAAKNVYAIASGIVAGLGLGESACAALIARSFAELTRLGDAMGARRETLAGLAGLGDLVLTATSPTSRNFRFGLAIGKGGPIQSASQPGQPLAEGAATAPALVERARRHGIELPIAEATAAILAGMLPLDSAIPHLMSRPLKSEIP